MGGGGCTGFAIRGVSGAALVSLVRGCPKLKTLQLGRVMQLVDEDVQVRSAVEHKSTHTHTHIHSHHLNQIHVCTNGNICLNRITDDDDVCC